MIQDVLPWLCLAVAAFGFISMVSAWFSTTASDTAYLLYTVMVLGGLIGFGLLV